MVISADTSFLFSLYGDDCHSGRAKKWIQDSRSAILISVITDFELRNAIRFSECRRFVPSGKAAFYLAIYENALSEGRVLIEPCDLAEIMVVAGHLSARHTLTGGHRGFDILHVASAKVLKSTHFLTFDANQKSLAEKEGFIVPF